MVVENTIEELKCRWRVCLDRMYAEPSFASNVIITCGFLHNFCKLNVDTYMDEWSLPEELIHQFDPVGSKAFKTKPDVT
jgi:hypothetical protein